MLTRNESEIDRDRRPSQNALVHNRTLVAWCVRIGDEARERCALSVGVAIILIGAPRTESWRLAILTKSGVLFTSNATVMLSPERGAA
jgi:hypothetical protein